MLSDPEQVTSESTRGRLPSLKADPGKASAPGGRGGVGEKWREGVEACYRCVALLQRVHGKEGCSTDR